MKVRKTLSYSQLPINYPTTVTLVWWMFLDHIHAPGWLYGVMGTVIVILWISAIVDAVRREEIEIDLSKGKSV